jgi:hypothetical protein
MNYSLIQSANFVEVFQPKEVGQTVNVHVVPYEREPTPDFEKMQRLIDGRDKEYETKSKRG